MRGLSEADGRKGEKRLKATKGGHIQKGQGGQAGGHEAPPYFPRHSCEETIQRQGEA